MSKLINPTFTIQNMDGPHWLVTFDHSFNDDERISLTVKVSKSAKPVVQVEREAFDRATELLQVVSRNIDESI